jgi:hypothetical protein
VVVLDLSMSAGLDIGSLDVLGRLDEQLTHEGMELRLVNLHRGARAVLERAAATGSRALPTYATMEQAVHRPAGEGDSDG